MRIPTTDFARLMQEVAHGNPKAFAQLFHQYNPILVAQLRSRLKKNRCLQSLLDPEELAQDIWTDFAVGSQQLRQAPTPEYFLRAIARITHDHILKAARNRLRIPKRDLRRRPDLSKACVTSSLSGND